MADRKARLNKMKESAPSPLLKFPLAMSLKRKRQQTEFFEHPAKKASSLQIAGSSYWDRISNRGKARVISMDRAGNFRDRESSWLPATKGPAPWLSPGGVASLNPRLSETQGFKASNLPWSAGSGWSLRNIRTGLPCRPDHLFSLPAPVNSLQLLPATPAHHVDLSLQAPWCREVIGPRPYGFGRWQLRPELQSDEDRRFLEEAERVAFKAEKRAFRAEKAAPNAWQAAQSVKGYLGSVRGPEELAHYRMLIKEFNTPQAGSSLSRMEDLAPPVGRCSGKTVDECFPRESRMQPEASNAEKKLTPGAFGLSTKDIGGRHVHRKDKVAEPIPTPPQEHEVMQKHHGALILDSKKTTAPTPFWKEKLAKIKDPGKGRDAEVRKLEIEVETKRLEALKQTRFATAAHLQERREQEQAAAIVATRLTQKVAEDSALAPLSQEAEVAVNQALDNSADKYEILVEHEKTNIVITREMMKCLDPGAWLNDEVINAYLALLKEREEMSEKKRPKCHFFNTFFYNKLYSNGQSYNYNGVKRWTSKKKLEYSLYDCEKVIVPVHQKIHWTLAVINMREKKLDFLDSMYGSDYGCLENLARYIVDEVKDKNGVDLDVSSWSRNCPTNIPEQLNGCDCGVFMVKYADYESRDAPFTFTQQHMSYFRRRMVWELLRLKAED